MQAERSISLPAYPIPAGQMIGPRSFRMDRIVPAMEIFQLGESATQDGEMTLQIGQFDFSAPPKPRIRQRLKDRFQEQNYSIPEGKVVFDFRPYSPNNWAHFLNDHLALLAITLEEFDLQLEDIYAILPLDTAGYIQNLCRMCGIAFTCTDATVSAYGVKVTLSSFIHIRGIRVAWMQKAQNPVTQFLGTQDIKPGSDTQRVYLSRKKTRNIKNDDEVMSLLDGFGFKRVFMEELSVEAQLTLLMKSAVIVAVHGAALAPLAYKSNATKDTKLIEIFPVGHVNNNFRCIADQIGAEWIGVLGRTEKFNIPHIYDLATPYMKHSLAAFDVDVDSVRTALETLKVTEISDEK